jgi:hypothetical protein
MVLASLVYICIPYSSGLPLGKVSEDRRPRIIKTYTSQDKAASTILVELQYAINIGVILISYVDLCTFDED